MIRCRVCGKVAHAAIDLDVTVLPVWSLVTEDEGRDIVAIGLCREHIEDLAAGRDLHAKADVVFAPPGVPA